MSSPIRHEQTHPAPRLFNTVSRLAQAVILLYGVGITGFLVARLLVGERWAPVAFANNFLFWWALGNLAALGLALFWRRRWLLAGLQLPGIFTFALAYSPVLLPPSAMIVPENAAIMRVVTYNILASMSDPAAVGEVITELDADIVGLQEVGRDHQAHFEESFKVAYPYQVHYPQLPYHGVALLSRHPILEQRLIQPLPGSMYHLRAVIDFQGTPVTVYVAHPAPPRHLALPWRYDSTYRDSEITTLLDDYLQHESGPLIVLGDFNMTDQSAPHDWLDARLDDAFREAGQGLGFSYPALSGGFMPVVRIDYVWHDRHFVAEDAAAHSDSGTSDHRPVIATLILQKEGTE